MRCMACDADMIHGGDDTFEEYGVEGEGIVHNLHCPDCESYAFFYSAQGNNEPSENIGLGLVGSLYTIWCQETFGEEWKESPHEREKFFEWMREKLYFIEGNR
jgi:hypothetical protein